MILNFESNYRENMGRLKVRHLRLGSLKAWDGWSGDSESFFPIYFEEMQNKKWNTDVQN